MARYRGSSAAASTTSGNPEPARAASPILGGAAFTRGTLAAAVSVVTSAPESSLRGFRRRSGNAAETASAARQAPARRRPEARGCADNEAMAEARSWRVADKYAANLFDAAIR